MLFQYKANYFLATWWNWIEFNNKWEFEAKTERDIKICKELWAKEVVVKKTTKK